MNKTNWRQLPPSTIPGFRKENLFEILRQQRKQCERAYHSSQISAVSKIEKIFWNRLHEERALKQYLRRIVDSPFNCNSKSKEDYICRVMYGVDTVFFSTDLDFSEPSYEAINFMFSKRVNTRV